MEKEETANLLEQKDNSLVAPKVKNTPESFDKYQIKISNPVLELDDDILKRFFDCGFTNEQAQLVYDLATEKVLPLLEELTINFEAQKQIEKLNQHFGGEDKFNEVSRQISTWAKQNIPAEVFNALASTSEGVVALYKMMSSNEPILSKDKNISESVTEESLKGMMQDPKYWRDKDNQYIAKITKGFEKLYPSK